MIETKPGPMEIDLLLLKLVKAGIILVEPSKSSEDCGGDVSKIIKETQSMFKEEVLLRHPMTVLQFHKYCLDILSDTFLSSENMVESVDFLMLASMAGGYVTAYLELDNGRKPFENPALGREIKKIFTEEEFERFAIFIKDALVGFLEQCRACIKFLKEFPAHENTQMKAAEKLLEMFQSGDGETVKNKEVTRSLIDECMLGNHGQYNLIGLQARESIGILPPQKEMVATIQRIMNVLDVLHYGGYLNFVVHLKKEYHNIPEYINFKKAFI